MTTPQDVNLFKKNADAWKYYGSVPPGYRHLVTYWVISARKADTHDKRLLKLIDACAQGRRL